MSDFDTTTWINDSTPGIADQQLNRIEAGVLDAAELSKQRGAVASRPPASNAYKNWLWIAADLGNALSYCDGGAWYDLRDYGAIPKSLAQAVGDLVVGAGTAAVQRLAAGTPGQHLVVAGDGSLQWVAQGAAPDLTPYAPKASPVFTGTVGLPTYTLATRPAASTGAGKVIYVSDAVALASIQVSSGTAWSAQGGDPSDGSVTTVKLVDGAVTSPKILDGAVTTAKILDGTITGTDVQDGSLGLAELSATGTKDATTFLRGDNTFAVPPAPTGNGAPNTQTANYTLVLADAGKTVEMNLGTALTATVPPNSAVAFPIGTITEVARYGAGTVAIAAGAGVTIRSRGGLLSIGNQYGAVSLRKRATDEWVLVGDLA